MNKKFIIYVMVILIVGLFGGCSLSQQSATRGNVGQNQKMAEKGMGQEEKTGRKVSRENCLADECLLVEDLEYPAGDLSMEAKEALGEAIDDEYKALSTYEAVMGKFGSGRPFSMISGAERQHIASLEALYDKYGLDVPENNWPGKIEAPATLREACQTGVEAEIANADLYEKKLLPAVSEYEDIAAVFENLMNASRQKHLPAFERCD